MAGADAGVAELGSNRTRCGRQCRSIYETRPLSRFLRQIEMALSQPQNIPTGGLNTLDLRLVPRLVRRRGDRRLRTRPRRPRSRSDVDRVNLGRNVTLLPDQRRERRTRGLRVVDSLGDPMLQRDEQLPAITTSRRIYNRLRRRFPRSRFASAFSPACTARNLRSVTS